MIMRGKKTRNTWQTRRSMGCVLSSVDIEGEGYRIKIVKEIAKGGFSQVLLCEDVDGGDKYAVKKIISSSPEDVERIKHEAEMHQIMIDVPNVVQLIALIVESCDHFLVFPFYRNGTIFDELERRKPNKRYFSEEQVLRYFESACVAIEVLHRKGYAHRDLKTANFLISEDEMQLHLTDFGSAARVPVVIENSKNHHQLLDESAELCSMPYRAPELFICDIGTTITDSIDIWSLGCCLYAFCFFSSPFDLVYEKGGSIALASQSPDKISYPENIQFQESTISLIKSMLVVDPSERPSISQILEKVREFGRNCQDKLENNATVVV